MRVEDKIRKLLKYNPSTGVISWKSVPGLRQDLIDRPAGNLSRDGRIQIMVDGKNYRAHRIAYLLMTGSFPSEEIDHINGDNTDNSWVNLRAVSRTVNQQNLRAPHKDNSTGYLGVTKRGERYRAVICVQRKRHYLGSYETPEEAHAAYLTAKREMHEGCTI